MEVVSARRWEKTQRGGGGGGGRGDKTQTPLAPESVRTVHKLELVAVPPSPTHTKCFRGCVYARLPGM